MANNPKIPKAVTPSRLSTSASYKIGGMEYKGSDISRLKPQTKEVHTVSSMEYAPRQASKTLENQSGVVNTDAGSFKPSETARVQTESYKPSVNTQATVQTAPAPKDNSYKPSVSTPIGSVPGGSSGPSPAPSVPAPGAVVIQTGSDVQRVVQASVQAQTESYHSNNAFSTERTEIRSEVARTPRTVDAVKTSAPLTGKRAQTPTQGIGAGSPAANAKNGIVPSAAAGGNVVRPGSAFPFAAKSVPGQYSNIPGTGTVPLPQAAGIVEVYSSGNKLPLNVAGFGAKTSIPQAMEFSYRPNVPLVTGGRAGAVALSPEQLSDLKVHIKHIGLSGNVATGGMRYTENVARTFNLTGSALEGKALTEIRQGKALMGKFAAKAESAGEYVRAVGKTTKFTLSSEAALALQKHKKAPKKNELLSGGKFLLGKAEQALLSNEDLGTESAGGVIAAGLAGAVAFKGAQAASVIGVKVAPKLARGTYRVATATGLATVTVGRTVKTMVATQTLPFTKDAFDILKFHAKGSGFTNTAVARGIALKAERVQMSFRNGISGIKRVADNIVVGASRVKTAVDTSVKVVHGVINGSLKVKLTKEQVNALRKRLFAGIRTGVKRGVKTAVGYAARGAAKGLGITVFKGIPKAAKLTRSGLVTAGGALMGSEDYAVQGVGYAITTADVGLKVGVKTSVGAVKASKYAVKTSVKAGKAAYAGAVFIKNNGLKMAWQRARYGAGQMFANMGRSIVTLMINGAKAVGMKLALPLLIICAVVVMAVGGTTTPVIAVGSIFGGTFTANDSNTDHDIREYLTDPANGIPSLSVRYRMQLASQMQSSQSRYHIVRFYANSGSEEVVAPNYAGVTSIFPTDEELANMIHPIFNAMLLMQYELTPTEAQATNLLEELFSKLFRVTTVTSTEQCGQALLDGKGAVSVHSCGSVHALSDCPNPVTGYHGSYTCSSCCYVDCPGHGYCNGHWYCRGHEVDADRDGYTDYEDYCSGCRRFYCDQHTSSRCPGHDYCPGHRYVGESGYWYCSGCRTKYCNGRGCRTSYCGGCEDNCNGYRNCGSHSVISYTLTLDGAYALEAEYFTKPIDRLSNIANRTEDQEIQLQTLKDYYQIYLELMSHIAQEYGGGLTMEDLSGVNFVDGTRVANQSVVDLALSQVGQQGGRPYWSYYGFRSRVEWCACFVHWCMRNTPSATACYPTTANNAYCQTIADHFKSMGQWGNRTYTNLVAGDTIFFDWEGDGHTDHIGIVIGRDDTYVYTVEGNSGDAVRSKKYSIGSSVIYGYGLMNY